MSTVSEGRDRVLREARALFVERGYAEVSMQQIADAVGMTKAALYYHFHDKEDLFAHVVRLERERLLAGVTAEIQGAETFHEQLERVARFFFAAVRSDLGRLMGDFERHVSEACRRSIKAETADPFNFLRPYFERAAAAGELRAIDLDFALALFFSMLIGLIRQAEHNLTSHPPGPEEAAIVVDVFLHGIGAAPRVPPSG